MDGVTLSELANVGDLIAALVEKYERDGAQAIVEFRRAAPADYLRVIAAIVTTEGIDE